MADMFRWAAPFFGRFGDRWDKDTLDRWAEWLLPYVSERRSILDVGGGTGALSAHLAERLDVGATVLDSSADMLAQMRPHPRVTGVVGRAEAMPLADATFDACIISDAFHHFRDQEGAVREIRRVVRPGGALLVLEFDRRGVMRVVAWGERLLGEPASFFTPDELCRFMADRGISGRCEKTSPTNFYFMGTVAGAR